MIEGTCVIYIAGPMSGLPEYNHPAFHAAEAYLQEHRMDAELINPAWNYNGSPLVDWRQYMRRSIRQVMEATELYVLKGWEQSPGARLEVQIGRALGLVITFEGRELASADGQCSVCNGRGYVRYGGGREVDCECVD